MKPAQLGCDAHVHVFDPVRFPYVTPRRFTPGVASAGDVRAHLDRLGLTHTVLVQPSVYGSDNRCLLDALAQLGPRARGVAVVSSGTPAAELDRLHQWGVRGARLNLAVDRVADPVEISQRFETLDAQLPPGWHIQLHVSPAALAVLAPRIERSGRHCVLDHLGLPELAQGVQAPAWQQQLALLRQGLVYVKLSAPYLLSQRGEAWADEALQPFIDSMLRTRPDRLLWGSNWPHTQGTARSEHQRFDVPEAFRVVDDARWLSQCTAPTGAAAAAALVWHNARCLYGWAA
jgi:predicted TIM-barrel fold metal-dependent hydrolase